MLHLLESGVLVHPGYFYGDVHGVHIMLSALTEREKLRAGLAILVKALFRHSTMSASCKHARLPDCGARWGRLILSNLTGLGQRIIGYLPLWHQC